jgi:GGDEF domain-containing protein
MPLPTNPGESARAASAGRNGAPASLEALPPDRRQRARDAYRSYYRWQRLRRLALAAFLTTALLFVAWLTPWLPGGLDAEDYTLELAFTVNLLVSVVFLAALALAFQELARRQRETLLLWSSVYEEASGLRSRTYLYDRLALECQRARRAGGTFSLLVLRLRITSDTHARPAMVSHAALQEIGALIDRLTHRTDVVALLSGSELAVLAHQVDEHARVALLERLEDTVRLALPRYQDETDSISVRGGASTYGVDGDDAGALVQAARAAAIPARPLGRAA